MNDYIMSMNHLEKIDNPVYKGTKQLEILSCWINDMKAKDEYNPPHTHHDNTGWSSSNVFKNSRTLLMDVKDPHKFKDGSVRFYRSLMVYCTPRGMEPEVGHFYIFEASHMQHCVMPFKTKMIKDPIRRINVF